nr:hypothetical protein [Tanacetum cinerariifolium]
MSSAFADTHNMVAILAKSDANDTLMKDVSNQGRMIAELDRDEVSAASTIIPTAKQNIPAVTITVAPVKAAAASTRQRR